VSSYSCDPVHLPVRATASQGRLEGWITSFHILNLSPEGQQVVRCLSVPDLG
jgi:hypothetical protein